MKNAELYENLKDLAEKKGIRISEQNFRMGRFTLPIFLTKHFFGL